jgi:hypothetical protein
MSRGQEVTQPNFLLPRKRVVPCYRCGHTRECTGRPSICESCDLIIARGAKIGSEDRRSIRAKPSTEFSSNVDYSYYLPAGAP